MQHGSQPGQAGRLCSALIGCTHGMSALGWRRMACDVYDYLRTTCPYSIVPTGAPSTLPSTKPITRSPLVGTPAPTAPVPVPERGPGCRPTDARSTRPAHARLVARTRRSRPTARRSGQIRGRLARHVLQRHVLPQLASLRLVLQRPGLVGSWRALRSAQRQRQRMGPCATHAEVRERACTSPLPAAQRRLTKPCSVASGPLGCHAHRHHVRPGFSGRQRPACHCRA